MMALMVVTIATPALADNDDVFDDDVYCDLLGDATDEFDCKATRAESGNINGSFKFHPDDGGVVAD